MIPLALVLALVQTAPPEVTASVDRSRLAVGEELVFTVRARTRAPEPLSIVMPPVSGFSIVGSRELTEVSVAGAGGPVRATLRELRLRADRPGTALIGPVRARQGDVVVETASIAIAVDSVGAALGAALTPAARALLEAAEPPRDPTAVAATLVVSADTLLVGEQLDLLAVAWFPREIRTRLRRLPVLRLATPDGVWAHPQSGPTTVAASRRVRGEWMDLFVVHQRAFPLAPGRISVAPAVAEYALPVTHSFFSREERYALRSDSVSVSVLTPPAAGRPVDDRGVVARDVALDLVVEPTDTRVGEPIEVITRLEGTGNVELWPEPALRWPAGFRAYPAEAAVRLAVESAGGRMGGVKTFRSLVVPDSAGTFILPELRYAYYDAGTAAYVIARAAPQTLVVAPGAEPRATRAALPLMGDGRTPWVERAVDALPGWAGALLLLMPALAVIVRRRRAATGAASEARPRRASELAELEQRFDAVLASHVPDAGARDGDGLAQALRAAGVEGAVASHVVRLRDRLRAARYGPRGVGDSAELAAELRQVLGVLGVEPARRWRRERRLVVPAAVLALAAARPGGAQAPSAEALYEAGALRVAADSFAARAARAPRVASHWYNLGVTLYRAGTDGKAAAALAVAARLEPRHPLIRQARALPVPPDAASEDLLAVGPLTPAEGVVLAGVAWFALWGAAFARRRRAALRVVAALALGGAAIGGREALRRARPVAVVVAPGSTVRVAPYGSASGVARLETGTALVTGGRYGRWVEVRRPDGVRGWVLAAELAEL